MQALVKSQERLEGYLHSAFVTTEPAAPGFAHVRCERGFPAEHSLTVTAPEVICRRHVL